MNRDNKQLSISHDIFHMPELSEQFDIQSDYINWISENNVSIYGSTRVLNLCSITKAIRGAPALEAPKSHFV